MSKQAKKEQLQKRRDQLSALVAKATQMFGDDEYMADRIVPFLEGEMIMIEQELRELGE